MTGGGRSPCCRAGAITGACARCWRGDLLAGITVAVVALPLALAFGVASGLGAEAGLVTAIVAGVVAGVFGGSHVQVSGPTGAMTVVLVPVVAAVGPGGVVVVALLAGLVLIVAGVARLGRYAGVLPWPVVEGFTLGIAVLIFLQQVPVALGVPKPEGTNTAVVAARAVGDWGGEHWTALAIVALVVAAMVVLPRLYRAASRVAHRRRRRHASSPSWPTCRSHGSGTSPRASRARRCPSSRSRDLPTLLSAVLAVAALAAIESLLSAKVADGMADGEPHDPDRELRRPGPGQRRRVVLRRDARHRRDRPHRGQRAGRGADARRRPIVHGVVLPVFVLVARRPCSERIPLAALAGVLMVTAVRMVEFGTVARIVRSTRGDAAAAAHDRRGHRRVRPRRSPSASASRSRRCSRCAPWPTAPRSSASRCRRPTSTPRSSTR